MAHDNRDSGCGVVAAVLLFLTVGLAVMVLVGLFYFRSASQAAMARDAANKAMQQARAAEHQARVLAQERDSVDAELNPDSVVGISLDGDGTITIDGDQVDLDGLRSRLTDATSTQFVVNVDDHCRFEHISTVLSVFDEIGVERPEFAVPAEE